MNRARLAQILGVVATVVVGATTYVVVRPDAGITADDLADVQDTWRHGSPRRRMDERGSR